MEFDDYEENKSLDNNSNNKRNSSTSIKHRNNLKNHHSRGINGHDTIEYKLNKILSGGIPPAGEPPRLLRYRK